MWAGTKLRSQNFREVINYVLTDLVNALFFILRNLRVITFIKPVNLWLSPIGHAIENHAKELRDKFMVQEPNTATYADDLVLRPQNLPTFSSSDYRKSEVPSYLTPWYFPWRNSCLFNEIP